MNCLCCGAELPESSRRDKSYCGANCRSLASYRRRRDGEPPPGPRPHHALTSTDPVLRAAAAQAEHIAEAHGWRLWTLRGVLDGLAVVLEGLEAGGKVQLSEVRARPHRHVSRPRLAETLDACGLLCDDSTEAARTWIERTNSEFAPGFAEPARHWLLSLLDGDTRSRPRSEATLYTYFRQVRPMFRIWADEHAHLREVTKADVHAVLASLVGYRRNSAVHALRSLFKFAKRRGMVFANPAIGLKTSHPDPSITPLTRGEIHSVERVAARPAHRLEVALAAEHAARTTIIRNLLISDVDLPNRRITHAGHRQRLGDLTHRAMRCASRARRTARSRSSDGHFFGVGLFGFDSGMISILPWDQPCAKPGAVHIDQLSAAVNAGSPNAPTNTVNGLQERRDYFEATKKVLEI